MPKIALMKYLIIIFLISPIKVSCQDIAGESYDSLWNAFSTTYQVAVTRGDIEGMWNISDGWFSESLELRQNGSYRTKRYGHYSIWPATEQGKWGYTDSSVYLIHKKDTVIYLFFKLDNQHFLSSQSGREEDKALITDLAKAGALKKMSSEEIDGIFWAGMYKKGDLETH